jgi:hypothetical protein
MAANPGHITDSNLVDFLVRDKLSPPLQRLHSYASDLSQFQKGACSTLLSILSAYLLYACITQGPLVYALATAVRFVMTLFFVFSLFTWLMLIYGRSWGHSSIYSLFLTAMLSELLEQFFLYNAKATQQTDAITGK